MRKLPLVALLLALFCIVPGIAIATDSGATFPPGPGNPPGPDTPGSLTTLFASNNNYAGNSFDITPTTDLTVTGWDVNLATSPNPYTVQVWWREGTANGFEQVGAGWTMLGQAIVNGAGVDLPTHVDVGGLAIAAGQTRGIIITALEAVGGVGGFNYTDGGPNNYSNAEMTVRTYRGLSEGFPPASVFAFRIWNGTVYYDFGGTPTEEKSWGAIKIGYQQ